MRRLATLCGLFVACSNAQTAATIGVGGDAGINDSIATAADCLTTGTVCNAETASGVCSGLACDLNNPSYGLVCANDGSPCGGIDDCCGSMVVCNSHGVCSPGVAVGLTCAATVDCVPGTACVGGVCSSTCTAHGHSCDVQNPCCNPSVCLAATGHCR